MVPRCDCSWPISRLEVAMPKLQVPYLAPDAASTERANERSNIRSQSLLRSRARARPTALLPTLDLVEDRLPHLPLILLSTNGSAHGMDPEKQDAVLLLQRAALRFISTFVSSERSPRKRRTSSSDPTVSNWALQWWDARSRARQKSVLLWNVKRPIFSINPLL